MKISNPLLLLLPLSLLTLLFLTNPKPFSLSSSSPQNPNLSPPLKIYVANLPKSFNYGLLHHYWSLPSPDSRVQSDPDEPIRASIRRRSTPTPIPTPYPENPLVKQYSAEYWLLGGLETPAGSSAAERVRDWRDADVVFVPFFAALSAEIELGWGRKGGFLGREGNGDYRRQRDVVDFVRGTDAWRRSGGRDHVFVLTGICLFLMLFDLFGKFIDR